MSAIAWPVTIAASSSPAAGLVGLVLLGVLIAAVVPTFRDRPPEGRLWLGVLALSIVYNLADDSALVLLTIPPILVVLRPAIVRALRTPPPTEQPREQAATASAKRRRLVDYGVAWLALVVLTGTAAVARCHWGRRHEPLSHCLAYLPAVGVAMALALVVVVLIERGQARGSAGRRND